MTGLDSERGTCDVSNMQIAEEVSPHLVLRKHNRAGRALFKASGSPPPSPPPAPILSGESKSWGKKAPFETKEKAQIFFPPPAGETPDPTPSDTQHLQTQTPVLSWGRRRRHGADIQALLYTCIRIYTHMYRYLHTRLLTPKSPASLPVCSSSSVFRPRRRGGARRPLLDPPGH